MARNKVIVSRDLSDRDRQIANLRDVTLSLISSMQDAITAYKSFNPQYLDDVSVLSFLSYELPSTYDGLSEHLQEVLNTIEEA